MNGKHYAHVWYEEFWPNKDCLIISFPLFADSQLQVLQEALKCDDTTPRPTASLSWSLRRSLTEGHWSAARPQLLNSFLAAECVQPIMCNHCGIKQAVIRCKECLPMASYCGDCDISTHKHLVLHNRETTIHKFYKPVPPSTFVKDVDGKYVLDEQGKTAWKFE